MIRPASQDMAPLCADDLAAPSTPYCRIKQLAADFHCPVPSLLALSRQHDPFFSGSPAEVTAAEWFAALWERLGLQTGTHLRRAHYLALSLGDLRLPDGTTPYLNTMTCWATLETASRHARYLGLVSPGAFVDRRNPSPKRLPVLAPVEDRRPGWTPGDQPLWSLPAIEPGIQHEVTLDLPRPTVTGYGYHAGDQPYHLECWIEKSTVDDVVLPVCHARDIALVTGVGFMSITSVIDLLRRARTIGKPTRVFYISDFDPAGDRMPVAVARQVEYWREEYAPGIEIKIEPVALSARQVADLGLPRIPIKETDLRRAGFEDRRGEGAVELDALQALYPGRLADLLRAATDPYWDAHLHRRRSAARAEAQRRLDAAYAQAIAPFQAERDALAAEAQAIAESFEPRLVALAAELKSALAPLEARMTGVQQAVQATLDDLAVDLPPVPAPETDLANGDEDRWLFDSNRSYLAQLQAYRRYENGD